MLVGLYCAKTVLPLCRLSVCLPVYDIMAVEVALPYLESNYWYNNN